ncbi:recombinase family protein [Crenobacter caeni]|uniref:Recombinase family protein n=1 Tax=Crenobacter caeni TaxID=2705474 RepID=A0A6B2KNH1_9NEIS|nr:recombinase family protein [Crenobacter caeni]NDV11782.1 recombinase family protein [Crenobacter caeni]
MTKVAIYARYSCEKQNETSLDDQIRRCRELAQQNGLEVDEALIFTDAAISGQSHALHKREGYQAFQKAWQQGAFNVFIVDEPSRLTRDPVEQAQLMKLLENRRVRMLSCDGLDSHSQGWEIRFGLQSMIAQQEGRNLRHRVGRGMYGQLLRGYMIATPAYGYELKREFDDVGNRVGSHWQVNEAEAAVVREVYARREAGQSMHQIAAWLNTEAIPCSRMARKSDGGYWRPARVRNLLSNTIYRGTFTWHGSTTYAKRAAKRGIEVEQEVFARSELRLVSDQTWYRCNQKTHSRTGYGGGKHALAGLFSCGCCGGTLVLSAHRRAKSLYCANCTVGQSSEAGGTYQTQTIAVAGIETLLNHMLQCFLTPAFVEAFRTSLQLRLTGDTRQQLEDCRKRLVQLERTQARLSHMLTGISDEDPVLEQRYAETRDKVAACKTELAELESTQLQVDAQAIEAQLQVDPAVLLGTLLQADLAPERKRALLARLFPVLRFDGKRGRYCSRFYVEFAAGAALALASGTEQVDEGRQALRFRLQYTPRHRGDAAGNDKGTHWSVEVLSS